MQLKTRLTFFTSTLILVSGLAIGISMVESSFNQSTELVRSNLEEITKAVANTDQAKLTTALSLVRTSNISPTLLLIDESGETNTIFDPEDSYSVDGNIYLNDSGKVIGVPKSYIFASVGIEGDAHLMVLKDVTNLQNQRKLSYRNLIIFLLCSLAFSLWLLRIIIQRDVERESENIRLKAKLDFESTKRKTLLNFIADASHELRTPLTIIKGYMALNEKKINFSRDALKQIQEESERLDKNIDSLMTVLEFESIPDTDLEPVNLSRIVIEEFETFAKLESNRKVSVNVASNIWIMGNSEIILKLIRNPLMNIRRHVILGSKVSLSLSSADSYAIVSIEDGGPLEDNFSFQLSDYSNRFSNERAFEKGGSGLGFSVMNSAVNKLSGSIELFQSQLGGLGLKIRIPEI